MDVVKMLEGYDLQVFQRFRYLLSEYPHALPEDGRIRQVVLDSLWTEARDWADQNSADRVKAPSSPTVDSGCAETSPVDSTEGSRGGCND